MEGKGACQGCGASLGPDAEWCDQCFAPVAEPGPRAADEPSSLFPVWLPGLPLYMPEEPVPPPVYSRWRGGTTTFGPVGRSVLTAFIALIGALLTLSFGPPWALSIGLEIWIAYLLLGGFLLKEIWKRDRVD
jgi:hypothetical protein